MNLPTNARIIHVLAFQTETEIGFMPTVVNIETASSYNTKKEYKNYSIILYNGIIPLYFFLKIRWILSEIKCFYFLFCLK